MSDRVKTQIVGLSGWHRGAGLGCYESADRRAAVEKVWREKAWKLWVYEGWLRQSSKLIGTYHTRKTAMMAYQPNSGTITNRKEPNNEHDHTNSH